MQNSIPLHAIKLRPFISVAQEKISKGILSSHVQSIQTIMRTPLSTMEVTSEINKSIKVLEQTQKEIFTGPFDDIIQKIELYLPKNIKMSPSWEAVKTNNSMLKDLDDYTKPQFFQSESEELQILFSGALKEKVAVERELGKELTTLLNELEKASNIDDGNKKHKARGKIFERLTVSTYLKKLNDLGNRAHEEIQKLPVEKYRVETLLAQTMITVKRSLADCVPDIDVKFNELIENYESRLKHFTRDGAMLEGKYRQEVSGLLRGIEKMLGVDKAGQGTDVQDALRKSPQADETDATDALDQEVEDFNDNPAPNTPSEPDLLDPDFSDWPPASESESIQDPVNDVIQDPVDDVIQDPVNDVVDGIAEDTDTDSISQEDALETPQPEETETDENAVTPPDPDSVPDIEMSQPQPTSPSVEPQPTSSPTSERSYLNDKPGYRSSSMTELVKPGDRIGKADSPFGTNTNYYPHAKPKVVKAGATTPAEPSTGKSMVSPRSDKDASDYRTSSMWKLRSPSISLPPNAMGSPFQGFKPVPAPANEGNIKQSDIQPAEEITTPSTSVSGMDVTSPDIVLPQPQPASQSVSQPASQSAELQPSRPPTPERSYINDKLGYRSSSMTEIVKPGDRIGRADSPLGTNTNYYPNVKAKEGNASTPVEKPTGMPSASTIVSEPKPNKDASDYRTSSMWKLVSPDGRNTPPPLNSAGSPFQGLNAKQPISEGAKTKLSATSSSSVSGMDVTSSDIALPQPQPVSQSTEPKPASQSTEPQPASQSAESQPASQSAELQPSRPPTPERSYINDKLGYRSSSMTEIVKPEDRAGRADSPLGTSTNYYPNVKTKEGNASTPVEKEKPAGAFASIPTSTNKDASDYRTSSMWKLVSPDGRNTPPPLNSAGSPFQGLNAKQPFSEGVKTKQPTALSAVTREQRPDSKFQGLGVQQSEQNDNSRAQSYINTKGEYRTDSSPVLIKVGSKATAADQFISAKNKETATPKETVSPSVLADTSAKEVDKEEDTSLRFKPIDPAPSTGSSSSPVFAKLVNYASVPTKAEESTEPEKPMTQQEEVSPTTDLEKPKLDEPLHFTQSDTPAKKWKVSLPQYIRTPGYSSKDIKTQGSRSVSDTLAKTSISPKDRVENESPTQRKIESSIPRTSQRVGTGSWDIGREHLIRSPSLGTTSIRTEGDSTFESSGTESLSSKRQDKQAVSPSVVFGGTPLQHAYRTPMMTTVEIKAEGERPATPQDNEQ